MRFVPRTRVGKVKPFHLKASRPPLSNFGSRLARNACDLCRDYNPRPVSGSQGMNILTHPVHTAYQYDLASTGHQFYSLTIPDTQEIFWDEMSRPCPKNYHLLPSISEATVKFDVALVHFHRGGMESRLRNLDIPIIYKEHCVRPYKFDVAADCHPARRATFSFSSSVAAEKWALPKRKSRRKVIIGMGVDTDVYGGYRGDDGDVLMVCHRVATRPLRKRPATRKMSGQRIRHVRW